MFKIQAATTFVWPVAVHVPQDGGRFATHEFNATFKMKSQEDMDLLLERLRNEDRDLLKELLVGWNGVQAEDGSVLDYSDDNRDTLINITYVRTALTKAYFEAISGNKQKK